jgi:hypothetical protein
MGIAPHDLVLSLRGLADAPIRRGFLREALQDADPETLAMWMGYLVLHSIDEDIRLAWLELTRILLSPDSPVPKTVAAVMEHRLQAHPACAVLAFLTTNPSERRGPEVIGDQYALEDVASGLRKARARQRSRDTLLLLSADPDPAVIRILLQNPLVGEIEAIRVASRRPQVAATFREVLDSARFGVRESVQAALVLNPWCPVRQALAMLPLLSRAHLEEVSESATLDQRVRAAAGNLRTIRGRAWARPKA